MLTELGPLGATVHGKKNGWGVTRLTVEGRKTTLVRKEAFLLQRSLYLALFCVGGETDPIFSSSHFVGWNEALPAFAKKTLELFRVYWNQQGSLVQEFYPKKMRSYHILPMFMEGWQLPWQVPKTIRTSTSSEGSSTSPALQVARKDEAEPSRLVGWNCRFSVVKSCSWWWNPEVIKSWRFNPHVWGLKLLILMVASLFLPDDPPILAGYILKI